MGRRNNINEQIQDILLQTSCKNKIKVRAPSIKKRFYTYVAQFTMSGLRLNSNSFYFFLYRRILLGRSLRKRMKLMEMRLMNMSLLIQCLLPTMQLALLFHWKKILKTIIANWENSPQQFSTRPGNVCPTSTARKRPLYSHPQQKCHTVCCINCWWLQEQR